MEILQFTLLASNLVPRGRTPFFAINSNRFGKPLEVDEGITDQDVNGNETRRIRIENGTTRKIFRTYLPELLKEKLLVRIKTKDNRSKYYSITPLGIIHLIKSEMFFVDSKYPYPERNYVILTLQTFAQSSVTPYHSVVFENQKFSYDINLLDDIGRWLGISFRNQVTHVFSNVNIVQENMQSKYPISFFEFFITNGISDSNNHRLAIFDFRDDMHVNVEELDKGTNNFHNDDQDKKYSGLNLNDEQFHHYLANLMVYSLIYDSAIAEFDHNRLFINQSSKLKNTPHLTRLDIFREKNNGLPEYFLRILLLFSKHVLDLSQKQYDLTTSFNKELSLMQFK